MYVVVGYVFDANGIVLVKHAGVCAKVAGGIDELVVAFSVEVCHGTDCTVSVPARPVNPMP